MKLFWSCIALLLSNINNRIRTFICQDVDIMILTTLFKLFQKLNWAIPITICTPPVEEPLSHVGTPLEFPQIFM
jgi:hypothetical protein